MTPNELLETVKAQFQVLYLDSAKLTYLLRQALGTWQDKAGLIKKITLGADKTEAEFPKDLLSVAVVMDAEGRYHEAATDNGKVAVVEQFKSAKPFTIHYFVNLRDMDAETDTIPPEATGILLDYLKALIDISNTSRARQIATATVLQAEFTSDEELRGRKESIELAMEESQAIIPAASVY